MVKKKEEKKLNTIFPNGSVICGGLIKGNKPDLYFSDRLSSRPPNTRPTLYSA